MPTDPPSQDDFRDESGRIDWTAFRRAVAAWDPNGEPAESGPVDDDGPSGSPTR